MQRFQYPNLLYLLWIIIPIVGLFIWYLKWKKKTIESYFKSPIRSHILPYIQPFYEKLKMSSLIFSILLLIIAIANPQIGSQPEKIKGQGIDIMILLDVSNSMLAQDIQPNRLERAKFFIGKLLDNLKNDRVGFIIFAGNSYLQVPLTIDFSAIKMSLPSIDPTSVPSQGTNIGEAVDLAGESLGLTNSKNKAIVIITDGEDHDENATSAITSAKKNGIKVFSIGVGEEKGAPIPLGNGEFKKDENGQEVLTAFNRKMLEELATIGNGSFYHLGQQSDIVEEVAAELGKIEGKDFEDFDFANYNSYFYWFALASLLLLYFAFIIPEIQINQISKNLSILFLGIMLFLPQVLSSQSKSEKDAKDKARTLIRKGNAYFNNKNFVDAEKSYRKALYLNPKSKTAQYNLGNALYEQSKFQEAAEQFQSSTEKNDDKVSRAKGFHNLGNAYFKANQLEQAIKAYENALKLNPKDMDTKFNLAMAKKQQKNKGGGGSSQNQPQQGSQKKEDKGKGNQKKEGQGDQPKEKEEQGDSPEQKNDGKGLSQDQAQKLLEALKNQEQNTKDKVEAQKRKPDQKKNEKDW